MLAIKRTGKNLGMILCGLATVGLTFCAQAEDEGNFRRDGGEYFATAAGRLPGEQVNPSIAIGEKGGLLVWQDNISDLNGLGIAAQRLDASMQPIYGEFSVNAITSGDQENPVATIFPNGEALIAWQSGVRGLQTLSYRILNASGIFGEEFSITQEGLYQVDPKAITLSDGNAPLLWSTTDKTGRPMGIYMQKIASNGEKLGGITPVVTGLGKKSVVATALENGFALAWLEQGISSVANDSDVPQLLTKIRTCIYSNNLKATKEALTVSAEGSIVANPTIAAGQYGIAVAWSKSEVSQGIQNWDAAFAVLDFNGGIVKAAQTLNSTYVGDQYAPVLAASNENFFAAWTSLGQDGSYKGIYGRAFTAAGFTSDEILVNTTTFMDQFAPCVAAADGTFVAVWSSYLPGTGSFDLLAQKFSAEAEADMIVQPEAPTAYAITEYDIFVSWPKVAGKAVKQYDLFIDDGAAIALTENFYSMEEVDMGSTHTFKYRYTLESGVVSPESEVVSVTTWGSDRNRDGLPDDWEVTYFGEDKTQWPSPAADSDGDGVCNLDEFLMGTDPTDSESVLKTTIITTAQGARLQWNTVPGFIYQVQVRNAENKWENFGTLRRATGKKDSIALDLSGSKLFRIVCVR